MEEITMTQEQITQNIKAAFDSVNLITELKTKETLTEEETGTITRNVKHLKIMMAKDWFVSGLTIEQKTTINAIVK